MTKWRKPLLTSLVVVIFILGISLSITYSQLQTIRTIMNDVWDKVNHRVMLAAWTGGLAANTTFETETTIWNDVWDQANHFIRTSGGGGGGGGDFSTNTTTSLDDEAVTYSGTAGKTGKRSKLLITPPATSARLTILDGKTLTVTNTVELHGTDSASIDYRAGGSIGYLSTQNDWTGRQNAGGATSTAPNKVGTSDPATCTIGDTLFRTDLPAGSNLKLCTATNTWTQVSGGGGGAGTGTITAGTANQSTRYTGGDTTTVGPSTGIKLSTTEVLTIKNNVQTISTNTTLDQHNIVRCVAAGGTVTATLPAASTTTVGEYIIIKDDATGICQVARAGSDTFNGLAGPVILTKRYDAAKVTLYDNGSPGVWWYTGIKAQWGYHQLSIKGADLPSSNAAVIDTSEPRPKLLFDPTTSWCASWTMLLNPDYGVLPQIQYSFSATSATTSTATFTWAIWKTTSLQAEDGEVAGYDTVNTSTDTVPGTAGRILTNTLALTTTDSMVAGDLVTLKVCRSTGGATGNIELLGAQLQYFKQ
jgi:hypothetical protein